MPQVISVSTLNRLVRTTLEGHFPLLWVVGEISNLTRAASGHFYFTLKDDTAQVRSVMFRSRAQMLPWRLEEGQQVEAQVLVSLYEARGDYQLSVEALRRTGIGRLYEAYARLRDKLSAEGLFNSDRKRKLPRFPRGIGIITSAQGAALHDVLTTLGRRAPHLRVTIFPTLVQGETAPAQIVAALQHASSDNEIDAIILARGGGGIEDLWAFNDQSVARAIACCSLPVVSGIGHETDTTIADFVADARAATPTAAAELASAGWFAASADAAKLRDTLQRLALHMIEANMQRIDLLARRLIHPGERLARQQQFVTNMQTLLNAAVRRHAQTRNSHLTFLRFRLAQSRVKTENLNNRVALLAQRLRSASRTNLGNAHQALDRVAAALSHLNPESTLSRGFAIVRDANNDIVRDSLQVHSGDAISLQFASGKARATIQEIAGRAHEEQP